MSKVEVPDRLHKEVKKFALEHDMSIKDAYVHLVEYSLDQKFDKAALKKILKDRAGPNDIIVGS
jgi:hypothetical protein